MTDTTVLDLAHAAMEADPADDAARLRFLERLADSELFLLLAADPGGGAAAVEPAVFALEEGPYVMAFDREERLAAFAGAPAPYAALPGRVVAAQLAGQGVGLALNLGVAPSAFLLPPEGLDWLVEALGTGPEEVTARPAAFDPPGALPGVLVTALEAKLALAAGLAPAACLAAVTYDDGRRGHMLAFIGAAEGVEAALSKAVAEALAFSGLEAGELDVAFLAAGDPAAAAIARVGRRFDLPPPRRETAQVLSPAAPGMDPDRPPKLR